MDKISAHTSSIQSGIPIRGKALPAKAAETVKAGEKDISTAKTVDKFEEATTRQERIQIALDMGAMNASEFVETGSTAFIGYVVGAAAAFAAVGGVLPVAVGGGVGALAGFAAHKMGWDKKIGNAVGKTMGYALLPFVLAGRAVKSGVKRAINALRPSKRKKGAKAGGDGKALPGKAGVVAASGDSEGIVAGKDGEKVDLPDPKKSSRGMISSIRRGICNVGKSLRALPKFLYPSMQGATAAEKAKMIATLDKLPMSTVTSTGTLIMDPTLADKMGAAGLAQDLMFDKPITLNTRSFASARGEEVLIHELGHTKDFASSPIPLMGHSSKAPWGKEPYFIDSWIDMPGEAPYAATNHWEDFAQSHMAYYTHPEELKTVSMEKYQDIEKFNDSNLYDKIMDKTGIREFGKKISALIDKVPHLRTALNAIGTIMGPVELNVGAGQLEEGIAKADITKKYEGKMHLAQGIAFSYKPLAPLGLGVLLSKYLVDRKLRKGSWSVEKANSFASKALAALAGPLGMTCLAAHNELVKDPLGRKKDNFKYDLKKPEGLKEKLRHQFGIKNYRVTEAGSERALNNVEHNLTKEDKIFMAKVGVGAAVGGTAGTAAGWIGGGIAGAAAGAFVGGPVGALIGGILGKVAGTMFFSYSGAKLGAKVGRLFDKESRDIKMKAEADKVGEELKIAAEEANPKFQPKLQID